METACLGTQKKRSNWFRCGKLCYSWWDNMSCLELLWDYREEVFITRVDENQAFGSNPVSNMLWIWSKIRILSIPIQDTSDRTLWWRRGKWDIRRRDFSAIELEDSRPVRNVEVWVVKWMLCVSENSRPGWSLLGCKWLFQDGAVPLSPPLVPWNLQLLVYAALSYKMCCNTSWRHGAKKSQTQPGLSAPRPLFRCCLPELRFLFLADKCLLGKCKRCPLLNRI